MGAAGRKKKAISFAGDLELTTGSPRDWPYFARWHYRSHHLPFVRSVTVLWHHDEPIGICVFGCPARALAPRGRFFGLTGGWTTLKLRRLNQQLVTLSRVVLHPTYRGAGLSAAFVRASCGLQPQPWIEAVAEMGHLNPFFERAGFVRVGVTSEPKRRSRAQHSALYGGHRDPTREIRRLRPETSAKSRHARPVYYIFDNRGPHDRTAASSSGGTES